VCWQESHGGFWVAWRYREVCEILTDPARFSSRQTLEQALLLRQAATGIGAIPRNLDPPLHGEYRRLLTRLVAQACSRAGESLVTCAAEEVLAASGPDRMPLMAGYAVPLIAKVLFRLSGFPAEDESTFIENAHSFLRSREVDNPGSGDGPRYTRAQLAAGSWQQEYVRAMVAGARPASPGGLLDLFKSASWRTHFGSAAAEGAAMLTDFIESGLVNTSLTLWTGILRLTANRDDKNVLLARPELAPRMTDEILRTDQLSFPLRTVRRDTTTAGVTLRVGDVIVPAIGLANRDEAVFVDPDRILLTRPNRRRQLAFGAGPHYCPGAGLAQQILTVSFASLDRILRRFEVPHG
jgi:cytochrome P450